MKQQLSAPSREALEYLYKDASRTGSVVQAITVIDELLRRWEEAEQRALDAERRAA